MAGVGTALSIVTDAAQGKASGTMTVALNSYLPNSLPSFGEIVHAYQAGDLPYEDYKRLAQVNGILVDSQTVLPCGLPDVLQSRLADWWGKTIASKVDWPTTDEAIELWYRGYWTEQERDKALAHNGVFQADQVRHRLELYKTIPEPNRLIDLAQRGTWSGDLIKRWNLGYGYPTYFEEFAKPAGQSYPIPNVSYQAAGLGDFNWFQAEWYAHWALPPLQQIFEMRNKLRPGFGPLGIPRDPSGVVLDPKDIDYYFSVMDIAPFWKDKLSAISHPNIQHRHLAALYDAGVIFPSDVEEYLRDEGYWERDVIVLSKEITLKEEIAQTRKAGEEIARVAIEAYTLGIMSEAELSVNLYRQTLKTVADLNRFDTLPLLTQEQESLKDPYTDAQIQAFKLKRLIETTRGTIDGIKKQFLSSMIDQQAARNLLTRAGVTNQAVNDYIDAWVVEFHPKHKELETKELLDAAKWGYISVPQLIARLANLGWEITDIKLLLLNLNREVGIEQQKLLVEQAKSAEEQQRQLKELAKQALEQQRAAHEALLEHGKPADLARWLNSGLITVPQFVNRMLGLGIPQDAIDLELAYMTKQNLAKIKPPKLVPVKAPAKKVAYPSESTLARWLKKGVIDQPTYESKMKDLGYSDTDIADFEKGQ